MGALTTTSAAVAGAGQERAAASRMAQFRDWAEGQYGRSLPDYQALWSWSVDELEDFWSAVARFFSLDAVADTAPVLASADMPGARWFPGATVNFTREVFRQADPGRPALVHVDETGASETWSWERLLRETQAIAAWLRDAGVAAGDRVVGYVGNRPEALTCFLACAALGATWAVCNQDVSAEGAAGRFGQLAPKVLLTATRSRYGGRRLDHGPAVEALVGALPSLTHVLLLGSCDASLARLGPRTAWWDDAVATPAAVPEFVDVPFEHPLWVLFSSGTTGVPKGLVHGHGGTLLQQLAALGLHFDLQPGDRFFWFCSTSWVMWNLQVSSLLLGATSVLYDGSPTFPDVAAVWRLAAEHRVTHLGVSPGLLALAQKQERRPADEHDLAALRVLGVTGAPLSAATAHWAREGFGVPLNVISGGTDVATAFVGANPLLPEPAPGRMGPPWLGVAASTLDDRGEAVLGDVGELVITKPMPSMPLYLWNDPAMSRYHETYFSTFPGLWRQGDWATFTPEVDSFLSVEVHGRSDATLNRDGIRLGTAEIYAAAESLPEVVEALVVGVERPDGSYWMPMFVHLAGSGVLDGVLVDRLRDAIRAAASPRHVPDEFIAVPALPHTLTGKRLEVPVKRLLMGHALQDVVSASAVDQPELLGLFQGLVAAPRT